ncbi:hypothetical protein MTO96_041767 [Rhipicephalus appendiculatus]
MSEAEAKPAVATPKAKGRKSAGGAKKAKKPVNHPKYTEMVKKSIEALKERGGSSRQAIHKYIMSHFDVGKDTKVVNTHLKLALKRAVQSGLLKRSKGTGASGSFRLAEKATAPKKAAGAKRGPKKAAGGAAKPKKAAKPKTAKSPAKKAAKPKVAKPKKAAAAKPKVAKKPKSPQEGEVSQEAQGCEEGSAQEGGSEEVSPIALRSTCDYRTVIEPIPHAHQRRGAALLQARKALHELRHPSHVHRRLTLIQANPSAGNSAGSHL